MANMTIFVNPAEIEECATRMESISNRMKDTLDDLVVQIESTQSIYEADSATEMREKFNVLKPELEKFSDYLKKVANYLKQNVVETAKITDEVAISNVANIRKPL